VFLKSDDELKPAYATVGKRASTSCTMRSRHKSYWHEEPDSL